MSAKLTIEGWEIITGIKILDPDGFNRQDPELYNRKFSLEQFKEGSNSSTIVPINTESRAEKLEKLLDYRLPALRGTKIKIPKLKIEKKQTISLSEGN